MDARISAVALAMGLGLVGCSNKGTDVPQQAPGSVSAGQQASDTVPLKSLSARSFTVIPTTACTGTKGADVTWRLDDILGALSNNRRLTRQITRQGVNVPLPAASSLTGLWPTNVDMDISNAPGTGANDFVLITIVLDSADKPNKPGLHFLRPVPSNLPSGPDPTSVDSSVAVLSPAKDPVLGELYCGRTDIAVDSVNQTESVTFGVKAAKIGARSLNIGIMVPTKKTGQEPQFWLPIFLDPNVKNEG